MRQKCEATVHRSFGTIGPVEPGKSWTSTLPRKDGNARISIRTDCFRACAFRVLSPTGVYAASDFLIQQGGLAGDRVGRAWPL